MERMIVVLASLAVGLLVTGDPHHGGRIVGKRVDLVPEPVDPDEAEQAEPRRGSTLTRLFRTDPVWAPVDVLGEGLEPHRSVAVVPGLNPINGNLTREYWPMIYNSLSQSAFNDAGGHLEHDSAVRLRDRRLFGHNFSLAIANSFLIRGRVHVDDPHESMLLYTEDRTRIVFRP